MSDVKVFWSLRLLTGSGDWIWALSSASARRLECTTRMEALRSAANCAGGYRDIRLVKVTRKPKPAAPPPLKAGDEVMVRATYKWPDRSWARLQAPSGAVFSVYESDIVRAAKGSA